MTALDRALVHGSTAAAGVTGLAYFAFKHLMTGHDPFSAVNHPLQPWALKAHVLAAPILVFAIGLIFRDHVLAKYRNGATRRVKRSGLGLVIAVVPATVTGYLLPALASGSGRDAVAWAHVGFGAALLALHLGHLLVVPAGKGSKNGAGAIVSTGIQIGVRRTGS
ncbi:MAG: hypothetical protein HY049_11060 [Acidobacteria bacterium]|nr:hypothetical protein [Acidobacteriota bacterium]